MTKAISPNVGVPKPTEEPTAPAFRCGRPRRPRRSQSAPRRPVQNPWLGGRRPFYIPVIRPRNISGGR